MQNTVNDQSERGNCMSWLKVTGGATLSGSVRAGGAKNAITKLLVASLLSDKKCVLRNVPDIVEVSVTLDLCRELGSEILWDKDQQLIEIRTKELKTTYIPQRFSGANRIPILMIGALLGRTREEIIVPTVGGCQIGKRPVDFHVQALEKLGATVEFRKMKREGAYLAHAHEGLHGTEIVLPYPSVGATENAILASACAKGKTVIRNAAMEPEVVELVLFLQKMGVYITLGSNRSIYVEKTETFKEADHTVMPDRVVAASFALAAACTGGKIFIEDGRQDHMMTFLNHFRKVGGEFQVKGSGIECFASRPLAGVTHIETDVHPGFLTDWQQPFVVLLTQTKGTSIIHETVYENRFGYTKTLKNMGADLTLFSECLGEVPCRYTLKNYHHSLVVKGPSPLQASTIEIPDLRAGFAYVLAALIAEGTSTVKGTAYLHRGYEDIVNKLSILGADIEEIHPTEPKNISAEKEKCSKLLLSNKKETEKLPAK